MPAAIALGTMTFTMTALPGTPAMQNAIPMPFFGTTPFAAPGLGIIASASCWLSECGGSRAPRPRRGARAKAFASRDGAATAVGRTALRERATPRSEFDPAELRHGQHSETPPSSSSRCCRSSW